MNNLTEMPHLSPIKSAYRIWSVVAYARCVDGTSTQVFAVHTKDKDAAFSVYSEAKAHPVTRDLFWEINSIWPTDDKEHTMGRFYDFVEEVRTSQGSASDHEFDN